MSKFFWSESIQNVSKCILNRKSRNRKFFSCKISLIGINRFSTKRPNILQKWQSPKIVVENFFLVGIDSECFKRILKWKSRNRKFSPSKIFLLGLNRFSAKRPKIVKKWQSQKVLVEKIFWSESIQNVSKRILNRKSRNRKFFPV